MNSTQAENYLMTVSMTQINFIKLQLLLLCNKASYAGLWPFIQEYIKTLLIVMTTEKNIKINYIKGHLRDSFYVTVTGLDAMKKQRCLRGEAYSHVIFIISTFFPRLKTQISF